ncbi:unnamed protein product [Urochloa humidicola]
MDRAKNFNYENTHVKLHAIVDTCHSGTILDLPYLYHLSSGRSTTGLVGCCCRRFPTAGWQSPSAAAGRDEGEDLRRTGELPPPRKARLLRPLDDAVQQLAGASAVLFRDV